MATDTDIREALREVIDPELGVNIVDLGLVYGVEIEGTLVRIMMTMTSPACPLGDYLKQLVDVAIRRSVLDVRDVEVALIWEPPWNPTMMSDVAKRQLGGGLDG